MRKRLDQVLVERGLVATRSRARDAIARGLVLVDGAVAGKAGVLVEGEASLRVQPEAGTQYVSRGALKLAHALDAFGFDPAGRVALDIGASTGGFTQVMLERGAAKIYALDVGQGQLHETLRGDARVVSLEKCDARDLSRDIVPEPVLAVVADVSFISLAKVLPAALSLVVPGAWLVALIKPQFEAGPGLVGKGGIVRDDAVREKAAEDVAAWMKSQRGWTVGDVIASPIEGGSGNHEFLLGARFDG